MVGRSQANKCIAMTLMRLQGTAGWHSEVAGPRTASQSIRGYPRRLREAVEVCGSTRGNEGEDLSSQLECPVLGSFRHSGRPEARLILGCCLGRFGSAGNLSNLAVT